MNLEIESIGIRPKADAPAVLFIDFSITDEMGTEAVFSIEERIGNQPVGNDNPAGYIWRRGHSMLLRELEMIVKRMRRELDSKT